MLNTLEPWQAIILGLVEGITEYLPISSTGHLILTSSLMGLNKNADAKRSLDAFEIVIQGGAILAVLGLYRQRVWQMIRGLLGKDSVGLRLAINIVIAFMPAAVAGLALKKAIEQHLFRPGPVLAALALGGAFMILIGPWQRRFFRDAQRSDAADSHSFVDLEHLTWKRSLIIGLLQCLALWPGTSRSMVTMVGGMIVGLKPKQAAEFSFLLGLPTLGAACLYSAAKNPDMVRSIGLLQVIIGIVVATISAAIAVRWLVAFLTRHSLAVFGWYRLALCAVVAVLIWRGAVRIESHSDPPNQPSVQQPGE